MRRRGFVTGAVVASALALLLAATPSAVAESGDGLDQRVADAVAQLDAVTTDVLSRSGVPGAAVAVVYKGDLLYAKGFGVRDVDTGQPVTPETVFQLASVSKSVGASVVAAAVGKGIVQWNDPVIDHLPWFRLSDPYVTRTATIGDMYAMRSGLPGQAGDVLESVGYDRREIIERIGVLPLDPFRITYAYTNFGITTGGEAVAEASGKRWDVLSDELLYSPMGMTSTSSSYADFLTRENRSALHAPINGTYVSRYTREPDAQSPAGGVSSNVLDMSKWLVMEMAGGWYGGRQIVASKALAKAQSPQIRSSAVGTGATLPRFYGYGMSMQPTVDGMMHLTHSGAFSAGAGTAYLMVPEQQLGIVVLSNAFAGVPEAITQSFVDIVETGAPRADWLGIIGPQMTSIYAPNPDVAPQRRPADADQPRSSSAYAGTYTNDFWGDVTVRGSNGRLQVIVGPDKVVVPLRPWDGDTFVATLANGDIPTEFVLTFTGGRQVTGLTMELGPSQDGVLTRVTR
jgi:CubicO group peptidase (beta-lactamase class C family)